MQIYLRAGLLILWLVGLSACGGGGANVATNGGQVNSSTITPLSALTSSPHVQSVDLSSSGIAINAGGGGVGSWVPDTGYSGGAVITVGNSIDTSRVSSPAPQSVYQSQRYAGTLVYTVRNLTPERAYTVRLHLVESFFNGPGQRVFDVTANGARVLSSLDIFQAAGGKNIAVAKQFASNTDASGVITIRLAAIVNNASIAGIEITAGSGGPTPTPSPHPSPTPSPRGGAWPAAGWMPYAGGPLSVPVAPNPTYTSNSASIVDTLWNGRSTDAGQLQVYAGPPPPSNADYSPDVLYFGHAGDPQYTVYCYQYGGGCSASGVTVHIPRGAYPAGGTDHHIDIRDTVTGKDVMLWEAPVPSGNGGTYSVGWGAAIDSSSEGLDAIGSTASGVSAMWSLRETDLVHNTINHAIVVSVNGESPLGFVYPAYGWDNGNFRNNYPEMGAHFWLDVPPSQLPSNCPAYAVSYLTALHKYGAYFIDNGGISSVFGIQAESDLSYTYNGGQSVWGPFMQSLGLNGTGMSQLAIDNCGINMQSHMHILNPPPPS